MIGQTYQARSLMQTTNIRMVQPGDSARMLEIYRPYVENSVISFEVTIPSSQEFEQRVRDISAEYPFIVYTIDEMIAGYAYAHKHMERAAYQWNATLSVYIDEPYQHHGIGKKLYGCLMDILKLQNVHNVYGIVTQPNTKSERLHEGLGFNKIGVYRNTGYKHGGWHDVIWFEKSIMPHEQSPEAFKPISSINSAAIADLLAHQNQL